ncbi:MAG: hypothetical protein KGY39_08380 [Anaerolineales bacterium]|nr:hypothetical protein [Anaerolineales bacterium]
MVMIIVSIFLWLHGVVHLLYFGHSQKLFELQPGLIWPENSWLFSSLMNGDKTRLIASAFMLISAIVFIFTGTGLFLKQTWWRAIFIFAIAFSSLAYLIFWNGKLEQLPDQGFIGILINLSLLFFILILKWPTLQL